MNIFNPKIQSGFALLIFLVVLMGAGGLLMVGFTQQVKKEVDEERFEHNKRVLEEAKQALLMYVYNYPANNPDSGPGRLPCPDTDNDGLPNATAFCKFVATGGIVGRFPWDDSDLDFFEALDASGERLWYAVSENFSNNPFQIINSDSNGTITIFDQTGNILYDGASNGVAAVIIAPGPPINRDENNDGVSEYTQVRGTIVQKQDPRNYLDTFDNFDNSKFINGSSVDADSDGFLDGLILGPINDADNTLAVNDQFILITTEEVVAMAEKATLQAYKNALIGYQQQIWGGAASDYRYPWLDPYDSIDLGTYDAVISAPTPDPVIGRLPSIFSNYFTSNASQSIQSELDLQLNVDGHPVSSRTAAGNVSFLAGGNLSSPFDDGDSFTGYVWDGHPSNVPSLPNDGIWEACPYVTGTEEDCNQDAAGNFIGGTSSDVWLQVREVTFEFDGATPFEFLFGDITATPLSFKPPDTANHAYIVAEYINGGTDFIKNIDWSQDNDFKNSFAETPAGNNGSLTFDGFDTIAVGVRYYPVLPDWARTNGWHNEILMAYSSALQPDGDGTCTAPLFPVAADADYCLNLLNTSGVINNKNALLIISGADIDGDADNGLVDGGGFPDYFADDLGDVFEGENSTDALPYGGDYGILENNLTFDRRPANGNDIVHVLR